MFMVIVVSQPPPERKSKGKPVVSAKMDKPAPLLLCDSGACDLQSLPCSGHGVCGNGTCVCDTGYSGRGYYYEHRDCHLNETTTSAFVSITLFLAFCATILSLTTLVSHVLQRRAAAPTKKRNANTTKTRLQRLIVIIYVRVILAGICSLVLESAVISSLQFKLSSTTVPAGGLDLYPSSSTSTGSPLILLRVLFPWLVISGTFYVVEWIVVVLPLQFLQTDSSRDSGVGKATAAKNSTLKWFESHYLIFDILYFLQFAWVGILSVIPQSRTLCGCWCSTVIELNVGWMCVLPLFFMNSALSTLINMVYKEREHVMSCGQTILMLAGCSQISKLYGAKSKELAATSSKNKDNLFRFRVLHIATMIAAYGAIIVCTLIALVRPLRERPEIFVEMTMWLAHLFDIIIVFAISGTNLPCRQGSMCRPSDGTKSKKENNNKTNNAKKKYQSDNNNKETFNTARGGVGVKKTDNALVVELK